MTTINPGRTGAVAEAAFRARLAELGAELLEPSWLGSAKPHRVRCAAGHDCTPRPVTVKRGGVCGICARNDRAAAAEARLRARLAELGAELLEPYKGNHYPHRVRCAAGHDCTPTPSNVLSGGWGVCRICAGHDPGTAEAAFRARLAELGGTPVYDEWQGVDKPHRVRCAAGHDCTPRPSDVKQGGRICRICAKQGSLFES